MRSVSVAFLGEEEEEVRGHESRTWYNVTSVHEINDLECHDPTWALGTKDVSRGSLAQRSITCDELRTPMLTRSALYPSSSF